MFGWLAVWLFFSFVVVVVLFPSPHLHPFGGRSFYFLLCTSTKAVEVFQNGGKNALCVNWDIKLEMKQYIVYHLEQKTFFDVPLIQKASKKPIRALYPFTCPLFFCPFLLSLFSSSLFLPPAPLFVPAAFCFSYKLKSLMWPRVSFPSRLAAVLATEEKIPITNQIKAHSVKRNWKQQASKRTAHEMPGSGFQHDSNQKHITIIWNSLLLTQDRWWVITHASLIHKFQH